MPIKSERDLFNLQKVEQLRHNEQLMESLASFCDCTKADLLRALYARCSETAHGLVYSKTIHDVKERVTHYGYYKRKRLIKNKQRELLTPNIDIQKVQDGIYKRLEVVPISLKSTGGKKGDSPENHAERHRQNRYTVTMDIENAYPSVDAARVLENIRGALLKPLSLRFPTLSQANKEELLRCIVFLTVYQNQLPQGVSTSDKIINIVFAKTDKKIQRYIETQPYYLNARYSRYKDDIAVSYVANDTIIPVLNILHNYEWKLKALFQSREDLYTFEESLEKWKDTQPKKLGRKPKVRRPMPRDKKLERQEYEENYKKTFESIIHAIGPGTKQLSEINDRRVVKDFVQTYSKELKEDIMNFDIDFDKKKMNYLLQIREILRKIITSNIELSNEQEGKLYHKFAKWTIEKLTELRERHVFKRKGEEDYKDDIYRNIYNLIGELNQLSIKHYIKPTGNNIDEFSDRIMHILSSEGWHVNPEKTKKWSPSSTNLRQITGVAFNERGERMLNASKRNEYIRIFTLLNRAPVLEKDWLEKDRTYREFIINGRVDVDHIKAKIQGIWARVINVYGERNPPRALLRWYNQVRERRRDLKGLFHPIEEDYEHMRAFEGQTDPKEYVSVNEYGVNMVPLHQDDYDRTSIPFPTVEDQKMHEDIEDYGDDVDENEY